MPLGEAPRQIEPKNLGDYLEIQIKSVFQSGMRWKVVESKWATIREAFHDFQIGAIAAMDESAADAPADDNRVIRNRRKLQAITDNDRRTIELDDEYGSFQSIYGRMVRSGTWRKIFENSSNSWARWAVTTSCTLLEKMSQITMYSRRKARRRSGDLRIE